MAGIKELKARIKSVTDTEKITNAMYLVACAKYRSNHDTLVKYTEYFNSLDKLTNEIISTENDYSFGLNKSGKDIVLVFGSDKGLAGDYNKELSKEAIRILKNNNRAELYVIGNKVKGILNLSDIEFISPKITIKVPDDNTADIIRDILSNILKSGNVRSIGFLYTECNDGINSRIIHKQILPIINNTSCEKSCEYIPCKKDMINEVMPIYLKGVIRYVLLQSFCSEQNARMNAMKNANDNAKELLSELNLEYNHTRQNAITREIIEISGERKNR